MRSRVGNKGSDSIGIKDLVEVLKFSMGQKGNRDPIEYILAGNQMRADAEKTVQTHSAATNEYDLKKTDMEQNERLDNRKQDWEEKKWQEEQGATGKMLEQVKGILEGPIGKVIGSIGEAAKDKYLGVGKNLSTIDALCPNCQNRFKASPELDPIQCPKCGVMLQKNPPVAQKIVEETESLQNTEPTITTIPKPVKPVDESNAMDDEVKKLYE
jgi:DNA-directed RNA polymerase subunit RPC12/RpoP